MTAIDWVTVTTRWSVASQILLAGISLIGFGKVEQIPDILSSLLIADTVVQAIEIVFYLIFLNLKRKRTLYRYVDWFVSTPVMLISTMALLEFFATQDSVVVTVASFVSTYTNEIVYVVLMNALMLAFGFCAEAGWISTRIAVSFGFLPFVATFALMFAKFAYKSTEGIAFLVVMCFLWFCYGVAAYQSYTVKNVMYNVLDIVSKNFYGVFVSVYTLTL